MAGDASARERCPDALCRFQDALILCDRLRRIRDFILTCADCGRKIALGKREVKIANGHLRCVVDNALVVFLIAFDCAHNAAFPALAERLIRLQRLQERHTPFAQAGNKPDFIDIRGFAYCGDSRLTDNAVNANVRDFADPVRPCANRALQILGGLPDARVDGVIEHGVIDPGRKCVAVNLAPILIAVNVFDFGLRDRTNRTRRKLHAAAIRVIYLLRHALVRRAARIGRMIDEPAFVGENQLQRLRE
ncbi:hypothetical protein [Sphingomonas phage Birtae]|nr:hypothetical protein [Sphingomonas phage Birtae]